MDTYQVQRKDYGAWQSLGDLDSGTSLMRAQWELDRYREASPSLEFRLVSWRVEEA